MSGLSVRLWNTDVSCCLVFDSVSSSLVDTLLTVLTNHGGGGQAGKQLIRNAEKIVMGAEEEALEKIGVASKTPRAVVKWMETKEVNYEETEELKVSKKPEVTNKKEHMKDINLSMGNESSEQVSFTNIKIEKTVECEEESVIFDSSENSKTGPTFKQQQGTLVSMGKAFETKITHKKEYALAKQFLDIELVLEPQNHAFKNDQEPGFESHPAFKCKTKRKCTICERSMNKNNMDVHMVKVHAVSSNDIIPCSLCHEWFPNTNHLDEHMTFHNTEKDLTSKYCTKFKGSLLYCKLCKFRAFSKNGSGRLMTRAKSGELLERGNNIMKNHMLIHKEKYNCNQCGNTFNSEQQLTKHSDTIHNVELFQCDQCPVSFKGHKSLEGHVLEKHKGQLNFSCDMCPRQFAIKTNLLRHSRNMHVKKEKIVCMECGKSLKDRVVFNLHMRGHLNPRTFCCKWDGCTKAFNEHTMLKDHTRIHTKEKPYKCDQCEQTFRKAGHRSRHKKIHTGEKPHVCHKCGTRFIQRSNMKIHVKSCR